MSPPSVKVQPLKLTGEFELLKSSIHSSLAEAVVPAQANSLIRIVRGGKGVDSDVGGGVSLGAIDGIGEGVTDVVAVGVCVAVGVKVAVSEGVGVDEITTIGVSDGVGFGVSLGAGEGLGVLSDLSCSSFEPGGINRFRL